MQRFPRFPSMSTKHGVCLSPTGSLMDFKLILFRSLFLVLRWQFWAINFRQSFGTIYRNLKQLDDSNLLNTVSCRDDFGAAVITNYVTSTTEHTVCLRQIPTLRQSDLINTLFVCIYNKANLVFTNCFNISEN